MALRINVLLIDDSPSVCQYLKTVLADEPDVCVVGMANSGEQGLLLAERIRPDVIVLDLTMPGMGGLATLDLIMNVCPVPVLVLSGLNDKAVKLTMEALERGAVDVIPKYRYGHHCDPERLKQTIITKIRIAKSIKVESKIAQRPKVQNRLAKAPAKQRELNGVIVMGASTGGPRIIQQILEQIPADWNAACVIVQHLPRSFTRSWAHQLDRVSQRNVRIAKGGESLRPGDVYLAPGESHVLVDVDGRIRLKTDPPRNGHRPSIDVTMESVAQSFGARATGVLLTGMGDDGARGLLAMRRAGGHTLAQDEASSVVFGMPQRALQLRAVDELTTPQDIARQLTQRYTERNDDGYESTRRIPSVPLRHGVIPDVGDLSRCGPRD